MPASEAVPISGALDHGFRRFAEGEEGAFHVDPVIVAPGFDGHFLKARRTATDAGIGDACIDPAEMGFDIGHGLDDLVFFAHVDRPCGHFAGSEFFQFCDGFLVGVGIAAPDRDIGIGGGKRFSHAKPDPPVAARDEAGFAGQVKRCIGHQCLLQLIWGTTHS